MATQIFQNLLIAFVLFIPFSAVSKTEDALRPKTLHMSFGEVFVQPEGVELKTKIKSDHSLENLFLTKNLKAQIIVEIANENPALSSEFFKQPFSKINWKPDSPNTMELRIPFKEVPSTAVFHISFSVESRSSPIKKEEWTYRIGSFQELRGTTEVAPFDLLPALAKIPTVEEFKLARSFGSTFGVLSENGTTGPPPGGEMRSVKEYIFKKMVFKFKKVDPNKETATMRTVNMGINTCISDPMFNEPAAFKNIKVETFHKIEDENSFFDRTFDPTPLRSFHLSEPTDSDGCFSFSDAITFDWYTSQRTYIKAFKITDVDSGASSIMAAVVNPWNTGWIFAQDIRQVQRSELAYRGQYQPRVFLQSFRVNDLDVSYEVDDQLKLHLKKRFNLITTPTVTRFDSLTSGSFGRDPLKGGFYLFNMVLVRKEEGRGIEVQDYITSSQQIVSVRNGHIATVVELTIDDLTLMSIRNYVLLQVLPVNQESLVFKPGQEEMPVLLKEVDQGKSLAAENLIMKESNLQTPTFEGPFIPLHLWQSPGMIENSSLDAQEIIEKGKAYKKQLRQKTKQFNQMSKYDKYNRLQSIELAKPNSYKALTQSPFFKEEDIKDIITPLVDNVSSLPEEEYEFQKRLCYYWPQVLLKEKLKQLDSKEKVEPWEYRRVLHKFQFDCLKSLDKGRPYFNMDKQIVTKKVRPENQTYMGGLSFNFGVGANFNFIKAEYRDVRKSETNTLTFSAGIKTSDLIPMVDIGLSLNESWASSDSLGYTHSNSATVNYNSAAYLVIQNSVIRFWLDKYQKCLVVLPNPTAMVAFLKSRPSENLKMSREEKKSLKPPITRSLLRWADSDREELFFKGRIHELFPRKDQLDLLESGLRLCLEDSDVPMEVSESYYYVTQHFVTGDMQDAASRKNKPWLLSIRSNRDFKVFIRAIEKYNELQKVGDIKHLPTDNLIKSYSHYNNQLPSWPSILNVETTHPYESNQCENESSFGGRIMNSALDFFEGPFGSWKGKSTLLFENGDFWVNFYCGTH